MYHTNVVISICTQFVLASSSALQTNPQLRTQLESTKRYFKELTLELQKRLFPYESTQLVDHKSLSSPPFQENSRIERQSNQKLCCQLPGGQRQKWPPPSGDLNTWLGQSVPRPAEGDLRILPRNHSGQC